MSKLTLLHISDTHFGPSKDFTIHNKTPYNDFQRIKERIQSLRCTVDCTFHTGDVISYQSEDAYKIAANELSVLPGERYFAVGNHDDPQLLRKFPLFSRCDWFDESSVSYTTVVKGYRFLVFDTKQSDDEDPSGILRIDQVNRAREILKKSKEPFLSFLHFPIHPIGAGWIDRNLLVKDGIELHKLFVEFKEQCVGVFLGHIHQPMTHCVDGINYITAPSTSFQFGGWPEDDEIISHEPNSPPGFNVVFVDGKNFRVRQVLI